MAVIAAHQQGAVATAGPDRALGIPGHVQVAVAIGDRDDRLTPLVGVGGIGVEAQLGAPGHHPQAAFWLEAHALQALAAHPLVQLPGGLAWIPGGEEIAQAANAHVAAIVAAAQFTHRPSGVTHLGLPAVAPVGAAVDGAHVGGQLGGVAAGGADQVGLARQLGIEEQAVPVLAGIGAVQQQARLAGDPALVALEVDADQAEIFLGRQIQGPLGPTGAAVVGFQDQAVAAHQEAMALVAEGHIQGVGAGIELNRLPGADLGGTEAGGDAAAQAKGQQQGQQGGDQAMDQALGHGIGREGLWGRGGSAVGGRYGARSSTQ